MSNVSKTFIVLAIFVVFGGGYPYLDMGGHTVKARENEKLVEAQVVEDKIRGDLPVGMSLEKAKIYLSKNNYEFSYSEKRNLIYLAIRNVKGGNIFAKPSLLFEIYFDENLQISSIDSRVSYTGP